jgi:hypothetical protein
MALHRLLRRSAPPRVTQQLHNITSRMVERMAPSELISQGCVRPAGPEIVRSRAQRSPIRPKGELPKRFGGRARLSERAAQGGSCPKRARLSNRRGRKGGSAELVVVAPGWKIWPNGLYKGTGAGVKVALMKGKCSSATGSCSDNTPKWVDIQTCIITC